MTNLKGNFEVVEINWSRLWTQGGLAWECFLRPPDLLFVPAHTLPVIRRSSLKTVVTIHDLGAEYLPQYHKFPNKLYLNKSTEYAVKHATGLIAVSFSTKKDLVGKLGAEPKKISVVYEGYDKNKFKVPHFVPRSGTSRGKQNAKIKINQSIKKYNLTYHNYFLFVGTVQPRKNLARLIIAYSLLLKRFMNGDLRFTNILKSSIINHQLIPQLVLAGSKGWLSQEIYDLPKKLGIEDRVRFLGFVPDSDLPALYSGALAFVFPSLYEGFGLPVLEAMAAGCPVITSNSSSLPEVAGKAARLVDPENVSEISNAMESLLEDSEGRNALIQQGFLQIKKFSWEKCAQETLGVFERILLF